MQSFYLCPARRESSLFVRFAHPRTISALGPGFNDLPEYLWQAVPFSTRYSYSLLGPGFNDLKSGKQARCCDTNVSISNSTESVWYEYRQAARVSCKLPIYMYVAVVVFAPSFLPDSSS